MYKLLQHDVALMGPTKYFFKDCTIGVEQLRWLNFPFRPPAGVARNDLFNKKRGKTLHHVELR
jgi:hypothetical protein